MSVTIVMRYRHARTNTMRVASMCIVLVAVAGCGGGSAKSDDELVRNTVVAWYSAVARGDGAKACALMTEAGRKRDLDAGGGIVLEPGGSVRTAPATCEARVQAFGRELARGDLAPAVNAATIRGVRVLGDRATATSEFGQRQQSLVLRRVVGRWLVDGASS